MERLLRRREKIFNHGARANMDFGLEMLKSQVGTFIANQKPRQKIKGKQATQQLKRNDYEQPE